MEEAKKQSNQEKSSRSYARNQEVIRERRKTKYLETQKCIGLFRIGSTNALESVQTLIPSSSTPATMAEQPPSQCREVIWLATHAKRIQHDFDDFVSGLDPVEYVESLIRTYFTDGDTKIGVFTDPLEHIYEFQRLHDKVLGDLLQAEGCTPRRDAVEKGGQPIKEVISLLQDICNLFEDASVHGIVKGSSKVLACKMTEGTSQAGSIAPHETETNLLPNPSDPDTTVTYLSVTLPPLKKGWAKGSCEQFLNERVAKYAYYRNQSVADAKDYASVVVNKYFTRYYWDDPIDEEPTCLPPPAHLDIIHPSRVPKKTAEIAQMNTGIFNWLNYRWKHPKKNRENLPISQPATKSKASDSPLHLLLCHVLSVNVSHTRANTAAEWWAKDNDEAFKTKLQQEVGGSGRRQIGTSSQVARSLFAALPEEEQKKYERLAKEEGKKAREVRAQAITEAGNLLDPVETQRVIEELLTTLLPFLEKLGTMLGLHASIYFAGPELRNGSQINVISMHAGYDKQTKHLQFPDARPKVYKKVTSLFQAWAETCFTDEEKMACALPKSLVQDDDPMQESDDETWDIPSGNEPGAKRKTFVEEFEADMAEMDQPQRKKQKSKKKKSGEDVEVNDEEPVVGPTKSHNKESKCKKKRSKKPHEAGIAILDNIGNHVQVQPPPLIIIKSIANPVQAQAPPLVPPPHLAMIDPALLQVTTDAPPSFAQLPNARMQSGSYGGTVVDNQSPPKIYPIFRRTLVR
ncbi:hypothetical protein EDD85DRAFT_955828 [Armillaria nabsnona]|nr:hypothetical protein EDD85DRAFT_955828 [Armillaria nabsnona]